MRRGAGGTRAWRWGIPVGGVSLASAILLLVIWPTPPVLDDQPLIIEKGPSPRASAALPIAHASRRPPIAETAKLLKAGSQAIRRKAITELGAQPGPESVAVLSRHLAAESNDMLRGYTALQLKRAGCLHDPRGIAEVLVARFRAEKSPLCRAMIIGAFDRHPAQPPGDAPYVDQLLAAARSTEERRALAKIQQMYSNNDAPETHPSKR